MKKLSFVLNHPFIAKERVCIYCGLPSTEALMLSPPETIGIKN